MHIQDVEYFLTVADSNNISEAAEKLFITYQGLWKSMTRLEKELGRVLLIRSTNNRIELSEFGKYFKEKIAGKLVEYYVEALNSSKMFEIYENNHLRIGLPKGDFPNRARVRKIFYQFRDMHPEMNIEGVEQKLAKNKEDVLEGVLDAGFTFDEEQDTQFKKVYGYSREYYIGVGKNHRLAGRKSVTEPDIIGETFLLSGSDAFMKPYLERIGVPETQLIIYGPKDALYERLIFEENIVVIFAVEENQGLEGIVKGIQIIPFFVPLISNISLVYNDVPTNKKILDEFIEYFEQENRSKA